VGVRVTEELEYTEPTSDCTFFSVGTSLSLSQHFAEGMYCRRFKRDFDGGSIQGETVSRNGLVFISGWRRA
jgi:hypothetical protein